MKTTTTLVTKEMQEAQVIFNNIKQLLCSNNLSLEIKKKQTFVFGVLLFTDQKRGP